MGIARGAAFLITEGRFYDLSRWVAAGAAPLGVPLSAWPGLLMMVLAAVFQIVMTRDGGRPPRPRHRRQRDRGALSPACTSDA